MKSFGSAAAFSVAALAATSWLAQSVHAATLQYQQQPERRASVCNGDSSLCARLYSNVTFIGAHDSYAIDNASIAANQNVSIAQQLADGVRMLQAQAHPANASTPGRGASGVQLCHTNCQLFNGGSLETWLGSIKSWSDANPTEVVTLLIVNNEGIPPSSFATAYESVGLTAKSYKPANGASSMTRYQWPTLGALIDAGTPIVSFLAQGADTSSVPYLLPEFSSMWETPYNQVDVANGFNCSIDRIASGANAQDIMYLSNQFKDLSVFGASSGLTYPDKASLGTTNSEASIMRSSGICAQANARWPNFILLDFASVPAQQPFRAAAAMNGVNYVAPAGSSSSSSSSSGSSGSSSSSGGSSGATMSIGSAPLALVASASVAVAALALAGL